MADLSFRAYRDGDEDAIRALFARVYSRELPIDLWRWRFERSPAGKGVIELAWDGDVLAGHYAVTPVWLSHEGERVRSGLSGTTMTHPQYRGAGLFQILAERTYRRMQEEGFACVWGFPNSNSHRGFVERLGWCDIERIPFVSLDLGALRSPPPRELELRPMRAGDDALESLWERMRTLASWMVLRDREYVEWRYLAHPGTPYQAHTVSRDGAIVGYSVTKVYRDRRQIVDLAYADEGAATDLARHAIEAALASGERHVDVWMPLRLAAHRALERIGFVPAHPVTYFGVAPFGEACPPDIALPSSWYYAMSDSDVF